MKKIMNYVKSFVIAAMVLTSGNVWGNEVIFKENENVYSKTQDGVVFDLVDFAHYSNYYYTSGGNKKVGYLRWIATTDNVEVSIKKISIIGRSQTNGKKSYVFSSVSSTSKTQIFSSNSFNSMPLEYGISNSNIFGSSGLGDGMAIFFEGESEVHIKQLSVEYEIVPKTQTGAWTNELPNGGGSFYLLNKKYRKFLGANNKVAQNYNKAVKFTVGGLSSTTISYVDDATGNRVYVHEGSGSGKWQTSVPDSKYAWNIVSSNGGCYIYHRDPDYGISNRPRYIVMEDEYYNSYYATYNMSYPKDLDTKKLTDNDLWLFISEKQYNSIFPYYFKATATGTASAITAGCVVQVSFDNSEWNVEKTAVLSDQNAPSTTTTSLEKKVYLRHSEVPGWVFDHWEMNGVRIDDVDGGVTISATSHDLGNPTVTDFTAVFSDNKTPTFSCNVNRVIVDGVYDMFSFENTSTAVPSANNTLKFYYSLSDSENPLLTINGEGEVIANRVGTGTITFVQQTDPENHIKYGTASFDIEVIRHSDGTLSVTNVTVEKNTWNHDVNLAEKITTTSDGMITVGASSDADVCSYADGKFHVGTKSGTASFEVSVPQTDKYEAIAAKTFTVTVDAPFYAYAKSVIDAAKTNIPAFDNSAYLTALEATHNQTEAEGVLYSLRSDVRTYLNNNNPTNTNISFMMNNVGFDYEEWNYGWTSGAFWNDQQNSNVHAAHTVGGSAGSTTLAETMLTQNVVLPAGSYTLSAKILVCQIGSSNLFVKKVDADQNIAKKDLTSTKEYSDLSGEGSNVTVDFVLQTETNVMMGVWHEKASGITWEGKALRADNFQLQYLGKINDPITWDAFTLTAGENKTMVASTAYSRAITFTSSDETIVSIADDGKTLVPHKAGNVTITASADNSGVYSTPSVVREINVNYAADAFVWATIEDSYEVEGTIPALATANSGLAVTYISGNTDVINVVDGVITTVGKGTTTLTAKTAGNEFYASIQESKTITVRPHEQYIDWDQSFLNIVKNGVDFSEQDVALVAVAKDHEGEETGVAISFSVADNGVATIVGNTLHLVGAGTTTITARTADNSLYETTSFEKTIRVRNYGEKCLSYLINDAATHNDIENSNVFQTTWENPYGDLVDATRPFSFDMKTSFWASRTFTIEIQTTTSSWTTYGEKVGNSGDWKTVEDRKLPANCTGIRFRYEGGAVGSASVRSLKIPMASYVSTVEVSPQFTGTAVAYNDLLTNTIAVKFADVPQIDCEVEDFQNNTDDNTLSAASITILNQSRMSLENTCGEYNTYNFALSGNFKKVGTISGRLHFHTAANDHLYIPFELTITPATRTIHWDSEYVNEVPAYTNYTLDAYCTTDYESLAGIVNYEFLHGADLARMVDGKVYFDKPGLVEIKATPASNKEYVDPANSKETRSWYVKQRDLVVTPLDGLITNSVITYLDAKSTIVPDLSKYTAVDAVTSETVPGSLAFADEGVFNSIDDQTVKFNFTPTDLDVYTAKSIYVPVTVQKKESVATATAAAITYGQKVSDSELLNDGETGVWTWNAAIAEYVPNAGTHSLAAHFVPTNTNMTELDATVSLTVNKAAAELSWTNAPTTLAYNATPTYAATSTTDATGSAITYAITDGNEVASIDANTGVLTIYSNMGGHITIQATQAESANYAAAENISVDVTITPAKKIYENNAWTGGEPTAKDDVEIKSDLTIDGDVAVNGMTIDEGVKVTLTVNGSLTVNGASDDLTNYGDLIVNAGGQVVLNDAADLQIRNLELNTELGNRDVAAKSSQVDHVDKLRVNGNAYIDITFDPVQITKGYYDFTVPFPVEAANGVFAVVGGNEQKLRQGTDYLLQNFSESLRAANVSSWKNYTGVLNPGEGYTIAINANHPEWNTIRFKKTSTGNIPDKREMTLTVSAAGNEEDKGWNCLGNGSLTHAQLAADGISKLQIYDHTTNTYATFDLNTYNFAVGTTFRVQATNDGSVLYCNKVSDVVELRAPNRSVTENTEYCLQLTENGKMKDQVFLSASDDALNTYEAGRDLRKEGNPTSATISQMWSTAYNNQLSVVELPFVGDEAIFPIALYAPQAGTYNLTASELVTDQTLYLMHNGALIWNLSLCGYPLSLQPGTNEEYAVVIKRQRHITTDLEESESNEGVEKIFVGGKLYVIKNGMIFDATGKKVK